MRTLDESEKRRHITFWPHPSPLWLPDISHLDQMEQVKGPPVRPVCGASDSNDRVILISMNFRISNFACSHVDPIASLVSEQFLFSL